MAHNASPNGRVNGGLSRLAKQDWERRIESLSTVPTDKKLVNHKIVDGKINGVLASVISAKAMRPGQTVRTYKGHLQIAAA